MMERLIKQLHAYCHQLNKGSYIILLKRLRIMETIRKFSGLENTVITAAADVCPHVETASHIPWYIMLYYYNYYYCVLGKSETIKPSHRFKPLSLCRQKNHIKRET